MTDKNELPQKRSHVPWISLDEWKNVCEDIYSNDIECQKKGYERLLLWKARQSNLPAGAACTMDLIHVHIIDQEVTQQISSGGRGTHAEKDLQLMFSSAVMRYLNHVSNVAQSMKDTLNSMANKLNIPHWLVQLRHDSAHRINLPSLGVFRMAVNFALDWLHENYWNISSIPTMVVSKKAALFNDKYVGELLDIWQSLKMYQINGFIYVDEVPDKHLRGLIMNLLREKNEENTEARILMTENTRNLKYSINKVRDKLFLVMKINQSKIEKLLGLLMESETFIPQAHYITESEGEFTEESILLWLCKFWKDFLIPLQYNFNLFPSLVHKLIIFLNKEECKNRQLVMALWINQLCTSMLKSRIMMPEVSQFPGNIIDTDINKQMTHTSTLKRGVHTSQRNVAEVQSKYPNWKNAFFARLVDPKGNYCPLADVKLAILDPNELTPIFLSSLLAVANPEIPESSKKLLEDLVSVWVKPPDLNTAEPDNTIHTVNDFYKAYGTRPSKMMLFEETEESNLDADDNEMHNVSKYDWATCPLGMLPWQKESSISLDIPSHITWQLSNKEVNKADKKQKPSSNVPLLKKKINWIVVAKRFTSAGTRLTRKRLKKRLKKKKIEEKIEKVAPLYMQNA